MDKIKIFIVLMLPVLFRGGLAYANPVMVSSKVEPPNTGYAFYYEEEKVVRFGGGSFVLLCAVFRPAQGSDIDTARFVVSDSYYSSDGLSFSAGKGNDLDCSSVPDVLRGVEFRLPSSHDDEGAVTEVTVSDGTRSRTATTVPKTGSGGHTFAMTGDQITLNGDTVDVTDLDLQEGDSLMLTVQRREGGAVGLLDLKVSALAIR